MALLELHALYIKGYSLQPTETFKKGARLPRHYSKVSIY